MQIDQSTATDPLQLNQIKRSLILPQQWGPNVLLLTTNHVGNTLFCTPAIQLLKKHLPQVQFDVVAMSPRAAAVFINNPDVNKVYCLRSKWRIRRLAKRYNQVIGLHYDKFHKYFIHNPPTHFSIAAPGHDKHRTAETLQFAQELLGITQVNDDAKYILRYRPEDLVRIRQLLGVGAEQQTLLVGIALGCGQIAAHGWRFWSRKRQLRANRLWSFENYIQLAQTLQHYFPQLRFVLTGSRNEKALGAEFTKAIANTINLIGSTSLQEVAALMHCLKLFITHDTGSLHVACSSEVPIVALFGPTQLVRTGPYPMQANYTVIRRTHMDEIAPEEVVAACRKILANTS